MLLACASAFISAALISVMYYSHISKIMLSREIIKLEDRARLLQPVFDDIFVETTKDAKFLATTPSIQGLINEKADSEKIAEWKFLITGAFHSLLESKPYYRQVRIIGVQDNGREVIRVQRDGGIVEVIREEYLQQKAGEPYFKEGIKTPDGQIYLSDITLNRENGKISQPVTPMIRAAVPLYKNDGTLYGILVINAAYDRALERLMNDLNQPESFYITDRAGNYLVHPDKKKTFGFEYGTPHLISEDIPEAEEFLHSDELQKNIFYQRKGKSYFISGLKTYFDPEDKSRFLVTWLGVSGDQIFSYIPEARRNGLLMLALSLLISSLLAFVFSRLLIQPLNQTVSQIRAYQNGRKNLQLPVSRRDELGELAVAFEELVKNLESARQVEKDTLSKLKAIVENTVDGLITIDENGIIQSYNKACVNIFGYGADDVIGKNVKILMPDPYQSEHDQYLQNYHSTGVKKIIGIGREVQGKKKDGTVFPLDLSVSSVEMAGRKLFSGIVRDITDRKKAEEEILRSNVELERFAYIASHDLQEPLRMVANFTALLSEEYEAGMDDQAKEYMGFIIDAARRMQDMVGDLLEYSRIGHEEAGFSEFDADTHIKVVLENLNEVIEETGASVEVGELPEIYTNPVRFSRLMQNLIGNAIKYRDKDRAPVIRVSAEDKGDVWLFSVADNGIGIKKEYLEQIFIIFKRLHGKNEYKGTGIGLAICKKIVEGMGGELWAESEYGQGTIFRFTLPKQETIRRAA